jgi:23S rRNA (adenine2503-C2)-methyltransferase
MIDIKNLTYDQLEMLLTDMGEKKFRSKQIYDWMHKKLATDFSQMTNISENLRQKLEEQCKYTVLQPVQVLRSKQDGTRKYLFSLEDGHIIESVMMPYKHGNSVCISTQVGCRMGCRFCASTIDGRIRNLTAAEMLEEVYCICRDLGERISNIVLMGSGEPFDNYDAVMQFLDMITNDKGLNISARNITISTCGLVPQIRQFADRRQQETLAISLHASDDETRRELMPIAKRYSIQEVLDACRYFFEQTGRRITFEYSLVAGVNDHLAEAKKLADLLKDLPCHVNLIPVNPIEERDYKQSAKRDIDNFKNQLEKSRINVTIRREMGRDIKGACGQLRRSYLEERTT